MAQSTTTTTSPQFKAPIHHRGALDPSLYNINEQESEFFKSQTGLPSDEELKEHILAVQREAYEVYSYNCIRTFRFTKLWITTLPAYPEMLELGKTRPGAIFLELGCCFGNDIRKLIQDGYPLENCIASDIIPEFWQLGHKLFKSDPQSFAVPMVTGDLFESQTLELVEPFYEQPSSPAPNLHSLTNLTPLQGHVSAIHISAVFHLFKDEEKQEMLARKVATLLSPAQGSIICGWHVLRGHFEGEDWTVDDPSIGSNKWKELWDGKVFKKGTVQVETFCAPREDAYIMRWTVRRM